MTWTTARTSPSNTLALVRKREEAAQKSSFRHLVEYQGRPEDFFREKLGVTVWGDPEAVPHGGGMRGIINACEEDDQVVVVAGKGLSKSFTVARWVLYRFACYPGTIVVILATTEEQAKEIGFSEVENAIAKAPEPLGLHVKTTRIDLGPKSYLKVWRPARTEAMQGIHGDIDPEADTQDMVIAWRDEGSSMDNAERIALQGICTGKRDKLILTGNQNYDSGELYEAANPRGLEEGEEHAWRVVRLSQLDPDVPEWLVSPEKLEKRRSELRQRYGDKYKESYQWRVEVEGLPPLSTEFSIFTPLMLDAVRDLRPGFGGRHVGIDVSRGGGDSCVAVLLDNLRVDAIHRWNASTHDESVIIILQLVRAWEVEPQCVHLDINGMGTGPYDMLHMAECPVDGIDSGAKPALERDFTPYIGDPPDFPGNQGKRRAELIWRAMSLMEAGLICIPDDRKYDGIRDDLRELRQEPVERGFKPEPKKVTKARIGRSPDDGDAFLYSLARTGGPRRIQRVGPPRHLTERFRRMRRSAPPRPVG